MTAALTNSGMIEIPEEIREELHLVPGEDFEVVLEDDATITLRRTKRRLPNEGLVSLLLERPEPLEIPERSRDFTLPLEF